jgi:hypothetical protein
MHDASLQHCIARHRVTGMADRPRAPTARQAGQIAWQRQATAILADLLARAAEENLPVLSWQIGAAGIDIVGRSVAYPTSRRRDDITAWAQALGIRLREHAGTDMTTITGTAKQQATRYGFATITLTCDLYPYNSGR